MEDRKVVRVISNKSDSLKDYIVKVWSFKYYIAVFLQRDLKQKYAQTLLGIGWSIIQPVFFLTIYTIFFSLILEIDYAYPYVLFVMSGLIIWNLSTSIIINSTTTFYQNTDLIKKAYFPKILLPLSKIASSLVDFFISFLLFILLLFYYKIPLSPRILLFPFLPIILIFFSLGTSLIITSLTLKKRDILHAVPFMINVGIWLTPVFYSVSIIPDDYQSYIYLNPIAAVIHLTRVIFFNISIDYYSIGGILLSLFVFCLGVFTFKGVEDYIVDKL